MKKRAIVGISLALATALWGWAVLSAGAQIGPSPVLSCPPEDPQPTTVVSWLDSAEGGTTPIAAIDYYLTQIDRLDVSAEDFVPIPDEPDAPELEVTVLLFGLVEDADTVALATVGLTAQGTWLVEQFNACYSFEQEHRLESGLGEVRSNAS